MTRHLLVLALAGVLATPLAAQNETNTDAQQQDAPQAEAPGTLSTGEAIQPEIQLGQAYTKEAVGDWELRCVRTETPESDPCQLYQLLKDRSGQAVSEFSLFRLPEGGQVVAGANVIVPLETLLTAQLSIAVDGANAKRYPFAFCNQVGCYARLGLTAEDVSAFKRGAKAQVQIRPFAAPDETVTVELSLSGFTAGFDKATVVENVN